LAETEFGIFSPFKNVFFFFLGEKKMMPFCGFGDFSFLVLVLFSPEEGRLLFFGDSLLCEADFTLGFGVDLQRFFFLSQVRPFPLEALLVFVTCCCHFSSRNLGVRRVPRLLDDSLPPSTPPFRLF